jgi:acyl-CoA synthetase (AMP-forming)/AMP-acid ligase II
MADGSDLLRTLRVSRAAAILLDPDVTDSPWNVLRHHVTLGLDDTVTASPSLPDLKKLYMVRRVEGRGPGDFMATLESRRSAFKADDVTPGDVLTVYTTSGSTGFSKLVVSNHKMSAVLSEKKNSDVALELLTGAKKFIDINLAPLGWIGGNIYMVITSGNPRVLVDARESSRPENMAEIIWKSIQSESCTKAFLPPKFLHEMASYAEKTPGAHRLKYVLLGGLPVSQSMVKTCFAFAEAVAVFYGATDFDLVSSLTVTDWQNYVDHDTGPPLRGVRVKIVSQDDESVEVPVNHVGHILVQHGNMPQGYLNDPQATADLFTKDGFVRTGDVGRLDERGHLLVEGRGSDAIMRGAYIHYPAWLEDRIRACPQVRDVIVVGIPDPYLHEELCACVALTSAEGEEEEAKALKEKQQWVEHDIVVSEDDPLSPRPRHYLSFRSLPETSTEKPRRYIAKKMAAQHRRKLRLKHFVLHGVSTV